LSAQAGAKRLEFEIVVVLEGSILFKKEREASAEKKFLGQRSFVHLLMFGGWARRKRKTYSKPSTAVAFAERKYQDKKTKQCFPHCAGAKKILANKLRQEKHGLQHSATSKKKQHQNSEKPLEYLLWYRHFFVPGPHI
jgi:hypothetical protein